MQGRKVMYVTLPELGALAHYGWIGREDAEVTAEMFRLAFKAGGEAMAMRFLEVPTELRVISRIPKSGRWATEP